MAEYITLTIADVDKPFLRAFGRTWGVANFAGRISIQDVGKRVYLKRNDAGDGEFLALESAAQRDARREGIKICA